MAVPAAAGATAELEDLRYINRRQLKEIFPVSDMTIYRWEQQGLLPKHVTIGGRSLWRLSAIRLLVSKQAQEG